MAERKISPNTSTNLAPELYLEDLQKRSSQSESYGS